MKEKLQSINYKLYNRKTTNYNTHTLKVCDYMKNYTNKICIEKMNRIYFFQYANEINNNHIF